MLAIEEIKDLRCNVELANRSNEELFTDNQSLQRQNAHLTARLEAQTQQVIIARAEIVKLKSKLAAKDNSSEAEVFFPTSVAAQTAVAPDVRGDTNLRLEKFKKKILKQMARQTCVIDRLQADLLTSHLRTKDLEEENAALRAQLAQLTANSEMKLMNFDNVSGSD